MIISLYVNMNNLCKVFSKVKLLRKMAFFTVTIVTIRNTVVTS